MADPGLLAPYAAAVGTLGLAWQINTWVRSQWTWVELTAATTGLPEDPDDEDSDLWGVLFVTVLNKSEFPVRVMNATAGPVKGGASVSPELGPKHLARLTASLPARIPAHDAIDLFFDWNQMANYIGDDGRVRVSVRLSTGWRTKVCTTSNGAHRPLRVIWRQLGRFFYKQQNAPGIDQGR
jgi:hypothetical protein